MSAVLSLAVTLFIFGLLIFIHELGHYIVARAFGIGVIEFAIGMGPKLKTWKGSYNDFTIRAIPIGGFVNMVGEYDEEIPEEHKYKIPLNSKSVFKRILVVVAGPFMNLLLAFALMTVLVATGSGIGSTTVADFADGASSLAYGLEIGDEIVEINGKTVRCYTDMAYQIASDGIEPIDVTVLRGGAEVRLNGVVFGSERTDGVLFGKQDFLVFEKQKTLSNVAYESFWQSVATVYMTVDTVKDTFTGRYGLDAVGGPIAIGGEVGETIKQSSGFTDAVQNLATLAVMLSVSLGVCNLLPIPVLDGGRLLFYIIEAIRRKPLDPKIEQNISAACAVLLFAFMIFIALKDLVGLF